MEVTTQEQFLQNLSNTFEDCLATAKKKNADYAGKADPFRNFKLSADVAGITVEQGLLVRIMDKMTRIGNLLQRPAEVKDEAITDSISDAINYLAILKAYIDGNPT